MNLRALWHGLIRPALPTHPAAPKLPHGQGGNPVLAWLDAAGLPWRATRGDLAARFGVHSDNPYEWDLVSLDTRPPPLDGMLWPFGFQAFPLYNPAVPPELLSTHVWVGDDAEANIGHAAAQLDRFLGVRPIRDCGNTRTVEWRWDAAMVRLTAWPPAMQSGPKLCNPAHRRELRLERACSVLVQTGWRPPISPRDRAWLDRFVPMGPTRNWAQARSRGACRQVLFAESLLEFMREPPADIDRFRGAFGLAEDGAALIVCQDELFVVPLTEVSGFEVARTLPAKGGSGSALFALCNTGYAACPTKNVPVALGSGADDLNDEGARLAAAAGKPFRLGEYDYDV